MTVSTFNCILLNPKWRFKLTPEAHQKNRKLKTVVSKVAGYVPETVNSTKQTAMVISKQQASKEQGRKERRVELSA